MMRNWVVGAVLFLGASGLYIHGAYPSVSVGDSGEFVTAAHTLGIPHPPGYPTYTVLAHIFQHTVPWANVAYRTNLFSAFCGAWAVVFIFVLCLHLGLPWELAACAALTFMIGREQMINAQASEVFALQTAFTGGVLIAALKEKWLLASFLAGLGIGNHQTILFLGPALALAYFLKPPNERPALIWVAASLIGGLTIYTFLYVRAMHTPYLNAGNPNTVERLWGVFTRADYGSLTLALGETPTRNFSTIAAQLTRFSRGLAEQLTWAGVALGAVGAGWAIWKRHIPGIILTIAFILIGPFFFVLGNMPFDAQSTGVLGRFYIVPAFLWTLLAAFGFWMILQKRWTVALAWVLPVCLWIQKAEAFPLRDDFRAYSYGINNLRTLPPRTVFLMDGGDDTFYTLAYLHEVENRRPDVELHDRGGVVFPGFYGDDFRQLTRLEKDQRRAHVEHARSTSTQPLWYSTMNPTILPSAIFKQVGLLYGVPLRTGHDLWTVYDLRGILPWGEVSQRVSPDYRTRALLPYYAYQRSIQAATDKQWDEALAWSQSARATGPDVVWLLPNLTRNMYTWAQLAFQAGQVERAERFYRLITEWDPRDAVAWSDLGAVEERRGHLEAAIQNYQTAIDLNPTSEQAHYNLAVAYWKRSEWLKVQAELRRVLELNPQNAAAQNYLIQVEAQLNKQRR